MGTISRLISKDIILSFYSLLLVLFSITVIHKSMYYLSKCAAGELSYFSFSTMLLSYIPELLVILVPLCFFLGAVVTFSKLNEHKELVILETSGVNNRFFLKLVYGLCVFIVISQSILVFHTLPISENLREKIISEIDITKVRGLLAPGRFHEWHSGEYVFFADKSQEGEMQNIFIASTPKKYQKGLSITAQDASLVDDGSEITLLKLSRGAKYDGKLGNSEYHVTLFDDYKRMLPLERNKIPDFSRTKQTKDLLTMSNASDAAELFWRLSLVIMVLFLVPFVKPLTSYQTRAGKHFCLPLAVFIFIIYFYLILSSRRFIERDIVTIDYCLLCVHGIIGIVAYFLNNLNIVKSLFFKMKHDFRKLYT